MKNKEDSYFLNIKNTLFLSSCFLFFFFYLLMVTKRYPYYYSWDMNLAVVIDNILLKSEKYSSLLAHPGFGMNLFLLFTTKIIYKMGFLSIESLTDLASSLDPISCVVELTRIIQLHSPFLVTMILFFTCISLCLLMKANGIQAITIFLIFSLSESNIIHSSYIRVGTYSTLFLIISVFFSVLFTKSCNKKFKHSHLFISGIFAGLSFLTKVQMFFLLTIPLLLLFFSDFYNGKKKHYKLCVKNLANISLINFLFFITLSLLSYFVLIPEAFSAWMSPDDHGHITFIFILSFSIFSLSFVNALLFVDEKKIKSLLKLTLIFFLVCYVYILIHKSAEPIYFGYFSKKGLVLNVIYGLLIIINFILIISFNEIKNFFFRSFYFKDIIIKTVNYFKRNKHEYLSIITVFMSGFLFSFLLHFFVFNDLGMSFHYMLYDFKVMFFRSTFYEINLEMILNQLVNKTTFYYKEVIINFIIFLIIFLGYKKSYVNINYKTLLIIFTLFFITHFNMYFGTRLESKNDVIFIDYPISIFSSIGLIIIYNKFYHNRFDHKILCLLIISFILLFNINELTITQKIFKYHDNHYRWQNTRWKAGAYLGHQSNYTDLINSTYTNYNADLACKIGAFQKSRLLDAKFVFPNQKIDQKHIGILSEGFPTIINKSDYKVSYYPKELKNAIVVDNLKLGISNKNLHAPDSLNYPRYKNLSNKNKLLAISPRLDLDIYFFTDEELDGEKILVNNDKILSMRKYMKKYFYGSEDTFDNYVNRRLVPQPKIIIKKNEEIKTFYGYHINSFTEINIDDFKGSGFFIIKQALLPT